MRIKFFGKPTGTMRYSRRPLRRITQLVIITGIIVGGIVFLAYFLNPLLDSQSQRVTEEATITESLGGICYANSSDESLPTKTIANCQLSKGTKVVINYQKGIPFANIISN